MSQNIPILIVDDEEVDRYLLKRHLKETALPITISECTNGKEALEYLSDYKERAGGTPDEFPPVLIFLDINMPLVNGIEFLAEFDKLRELANMTGSVVMMFSSSERPEDKEAILQYEFVKGYLVKGTFNSNQLKQKILAVVSVDKE